MRRQRVFLVEFLLLSLLAPSGTVSCKGEEELVTELKPDERIVFLATDARLSQDGRTWTVPIHAWVHELERSLVRKGLIAAVLKQQYGLETSPKTQDNFDRRVRLFLVDNERGKRVVVRLAGRLFESPPTGANGHVQFEVELDTRSVSRAAGNGVLPVTAALPRADERVFRGYVQLVEPEGLSVISDIDDTVKVTQVTNRAAALERTFFQDFEAVPGMPEFYRRLARDGARLHFVSSSPWQLYEPLDEFLTGSGFPPRSLSLKPVRLTDRTIQNLFQPGTKTKPLQIEPILKAFPRRQFLLLGDSGQQDPEVYAALQQKYPAQIARIYLRNVTDESPGDERYRRLFGGLGAEKWQLFTDPAQLDWP